MSFEVNAATLSFEVINLAEPITADQWSNKEQRVQGSETKEPKVAPFDNTKVLKAAPYGTLKAKVDGRVDDNSTVEVLNPPAEIEALRAYVPAGKVWVQPRAIQSGKYARSALTVMCETLVPADEAKK